MDTRAYLEWCVKSHKFTRDRAKQAATWFAYVMALVAMAGLWIAGWVLG